MLSAQNSFRVFLKHLMVLKMIEPASLSCVLFPGPKCGRQAQHQGDPRGRPGPGYMERSIRETSSPCTKLAHARHWDDRGKRMGGACDLAMTCDMLVGAPTATFAITPVKLGLSYNTAGVNHFLGCFPFTL